MPEKETGMSKGKVYCLTKPKEALLAVPFLVILYFNNSKPASFL
jgi:hypothetical protein